MSPAQIPPEEIAFAPAADGDLEELVALRIAAMRESLERLGRFDATRARERLATTFVPGATRHIVVRGERVGFVTVKRDERELLLEHLYVHPHHQGRGIGSAVLASVLRDADACGLPVHVCALRGSRANELYGRHGFLFVRETEWDHHYVRPGAAVF
jgi:ribosomal protein S18 acetylase RimI-like enzyme